MKIQSTKSAVVDTHFGHITLEQVGDNPIRLFITAGTSMDPEIFLVELTTALSEFKAAK